MPPAPSSTINSTSSSTSTKSPSVQSKLDPHAPSLHLINQSNQVINKAKPPSTKSPSKQSLHQPSHHQSLNHHPPKLGHHTKLQSVARFTKYRVQVDRKTSKIAKPPSSSKNSKVDSKHQATNLAHHFLHVTKP